MIDRIVRPLLKVSGVLKHKSKKYIAGPDPESAINRARQLKDAGYLSCIAFLNAARNEADVRANVTVYQRLVDMINILGLRANVSVSLSQLGFSLDQFLARELVRQVVIHSVRRDALVWIDTSQKVDPELNLQIASDLHRVPGVEGHVGVTIEANRYRAGHDLALAVNEGIPVRLRTGGRSNDRGATLRGTSQVRHNSRRLIELLLSSHNYCCISTRDKNLMSHATEFVAVKRLSPNTFEFEIPDGTNILEPLMPGANIRRLVPFGPDYEHYVVQTILRLDRSPGI